MDEPEGSASGSPPAPSGPPSRLALAVADVNWYTTETLFRAVDPGRAESLLLHCSDVVNAIHRRWPPWRWRRPIERLGSGSSRCELVLPSGWMKRYPLLGMRPIAGTIRRWRDTLDGPAEPCLVMTYPHYRYLRDQIKPSISVYFNVDDYALYWPKDSARLRDLEAELVGESDLTVCVSRARRDELASRVPEALAEGRLVHLPHAAPGWSLEGGPQYEPATPPPELAGIDGPRIGYVGGLEDRVDWELLDRLAVRFPRARLVLVGPIRPKGVDRSAAWIAARERCLARSNVHAVGHIPQERLGRFIRSFDVGLIPYLPEHPFNRACCPTKIMDYLGTGRPVISTMLPECELWPELIDVASDEFAFLDAVSHRLETPGDEAGVLRRYQVASDWSAPRVASRLLDHLDRRRYAPADPGRLLHG